MSPKWNNYAVHPDSWDSSSASVHPLLIKHVCVLKAQLAALCFPLGAFHELKQKQRPDYIADTEKDRPCCSKGLVHLREAGVDMP